MRGLLLVAGGALALAACHDDSCLRGECTTPCARVAMTCTPQPLYVGRVADAPAGYRLVRGSGADDDLLVSNGRVTAVIAGIDGQLDLAPTGGTLIDLGRAGGLDDVTVIYQLAGILPDDAFAYRTLEVTERADAVAVTVRGTLDGRPDVDVVTHYELGACDDGVRVRSELFNGSPETHAWVIADASHWGKRRVVPFVPAKDQGYAQPELDLLELTAMWDPHDHVAGAAPATDSPGYAAIACDRETLDGVNDVEISALGTPMTFVEPGDTLVLERLLIVAGEGAGPAPAIDAALAARAQVFETATREVSGRIVAGGAPFGGDVRRASVLVRAGGVPVTAVVPAADGTFRATVRDRGPLVAEVWSFGRKVSEVEVEADGALGDLGIEAPATISLRVVVPPAGDHWARVMFHPADEVTRANVTGTFHGELAACAPWLGPPHGASPACNQVLIPGAPVEVEVPAGRYEVYATAGPEYALARQGVDLVAGGRTDVVLQLAKLDLVPPGWLSADLHVHGRASFDSMIPDLDRAATFAAEGVQVIAATDHDVIGDYAEAIRTLGIDAQVAVMGGLEATQLIPWLEVPGEDLPRVIGHFNFWPLRRLPGEPRAGAPSDENLEPGALFDIMEPLVGAHGVMMLNHPWDEPFFGRDLGYLRAIDFDPRRALDDRATNNAMLLDRPRGRHRNADWDVIEILNGADQVEMQKARVLWHALLAQGLLYPGAGNSDSHGLTDAQLGWSRNWVQVATSVTAFDADAFNDAVRAGQFVAGSGIFVTVEIGAANGPRRGVGIAPYAASAGDVVEITVRAPPWVPVEEVRVVTSRGTRVLASGAALWQPSSPFATDRTLRYQAAFPVTELVTGDDFLIVEAGLPYPEAADLDDDGVPDTTDNNRDGVVDDRDVEPDEDAGPFSVPPDPTDPADPRYWVTRVVPGAWPVGFANPLIIDVDGGGWLPPGLP